MSRSKKSAAHTSRFFSKVEIYFKAMSASRPLVITTASSHIYSNKSASYSFGTITYFSRRRRIIMTIVSTNKITGEGAKSVAFIMNSVQAGLSTQTSIPGPFAVRRRLGAQHSRNPHLY